MPFATQAPLTNWDALHEEACEEASLILVRHYLDSLPLDNQTMENEIQEMVAWETNHGLPVDVTAAELGDIAKQMYGYSYQVIEGNDVTIERIEQEIALGNPVILPLAGQDIGNPNFTGAGPPYHVLVVVGYDAKNFITHDVGTRKGKNYVYPKHVLFDAIHDWIGSVDTIRSGPKAMLIVTK